MITYNRVFVEPYKKTSLRSEAKKGLALGVGQKVTIAKMKILSDAKLTMGTENVDLLAGGDLLVRESDLHNGLVNIKEIMELDGVSGNFIIVEANYIVGYEGPKKGKK